MGGSRNNYKIAVYPSIKETCNISFLIGLFSDNLVHLFSLEIFSSKWDLFMMSAFNLKGKPITVYTHFLSNSNISED